MRCHSFEHARIRTTRWTAAAAMGVTVIFAQTVVTPSKNGSIQGTVVGSDGTPLPGTRVYAAIKATVGNTKAPPTLTSSVVGGATASPGNTFTISNLPTGSYVLCAATTSPGWTPATGQRPSQRSTYSRAKVSRAKAW